MKQSYEVFEPIGFTEPIPSLNRPAPQKPRRPAGPGVVDSWSSSGTLASPVMQPQGSAKRLAAPAVRKRTWAIVFGGTVAATAAAVGAISVQEPGSLRRQVDQLVGKISEATHRDQSASGATDSGAVAMVAAAPPQELAAMPSAAEPDAKPAPGAEPVGATEIIGSPATAVASTRSKLTAEIKDSPQAIDRQRAPDLPLQVLSTLPAPAADIAASAPALPASSVLPPVSPPVAAASTPASSPPPAQTASEAEGGVQQAD